MTADEIKSAIIVPVGYDKLPKKKFLVALPAFPKDKGFCHQTILVSGIDENDALSKARRLKPNHNIGDYKEVNY